MRERRYPIGIQTFSEIIRKGYLYADIYGRKEGETTPGPYCKASPSSPS